MSQLWHHGKKPILNRTYHQWRGQIPRRKEHILPVILSGSALPQKNPEDPELMSTFFRQARAQHHIPAAVNYSAIVNYGSLWSLSSQICYSPRPWVFVCRDMVGDHACLYLSGKDNGLRCLNGWQLLEIYCFSGIFILKVPSNHICYLKQK